MPPWPSTGTFQPASGVTYRAAETRNAHVDRRSIARQLAVTAGLAAQLARSEVAPALPRRPSDFASSRVIQELLNTQGAGNVDQIEIADVRLLDLTAPTSNSTNLVLEIDADDPRIPNRVYAKFPSPSFATRAFCHVLAVSRIECRFYEALAPHASIRVPHAYAVASDKAQYILVLEDLGSTPGIGLNTNAALRAGVDMKTARACLSTLAALHASFWKLDPSLRDAALSPDLHPFTSERGRWLSPALSKAALGPCRRRAPDLVDDQIAGVYRNGMELWPVLLDRWYSQPLTLVHGDSHIGNFFSTPDGMGMLDWQAAHWAPGLRDVQYFLIDSVPTELLADNETRLVEHYVAQLANHGVDLELEAALDSYRSLVFQTLVTNVVSLGLGALTEAEDVMRTVLARSVAATRRLEIDEWLRETVARASLRP